jgi:hypothetical protein
VCAAQHEAHQTRLEQARRALQRWPVRSKYAIGHTWSVFSCLTCSRTRSAPPHARMQRTLRVAMCGKNARREGITMVRQHFTLYGWPNSNQTPIRRGTPGRPLHRTRQSQNDDRSTAGSVQKKNGLARLRRKNSAAPRSGEVRGAVHRELHGAQEWMEERCSELRRDRSDAAANCIAAGLRTRGKHGCKRASAASARMSISLKSVAAAPSARTGGSGQRQLRARQGEAHTPHSSHKSRSKRRQRLYESALRARF